MDKLLHWLAFIFLTGTLLLFALGAIAALDEFAKVPFYHTLPLVAGSVNGALLFLLLRRHGRTGVVDQLYSRLRPRVRAEQEVVGARDGSESCQGVGRPVKSISENFARPSTQELSAALAMIHSVAWSDSLGRNANSTYQVERANDEARQ
jgi:hypothetical protein